jgi:SSS family solute:Na+ symporter
MHGFLTLTDYLFFRFGPRTGYLGFALQFAGFLFLLAAQFIVGGRLFANLTSISYPVAVVIMGVVTVAYVLLGGFKAVIRTDVLQFAVMFAVFAVLVPMRADFSQLDLEFNLASPGVIGSASLFLGAIGGLFVGGDIWQRVYSAKSGGVARTSLLLAAGIWLIFGTSIAIIGVAAKGADGVSAENALFAGLFQLLPQELAGVATVAVLAALMSTIDTEVFLLASMFAKDYLARRRELTPDGMTKVIRYAMVGVAAPAMGIAIVWPSILGVLFILLSLLMALFPTILVSLFRPVGPNVAFASVLIGSLLITPAFLFGWSSQDTAPLLVMAGSGAVVALGLLRPTPAES